MRADIADSDALDRLFAKVDTVIHSCGPPSVSKSRAAASEYFRVHGLGTSVVLESCVRSGVRRLVYLSSAEVYGHNNSEAVHETQALAASSPYAAAKIGGEEMIRAFVMEGRIEAVILRPFSIYGPRMNGSSVVSEVLMQAMRGSVIRVQDTRPIRDFCFVKDIASAIVSACMVPIRG
jgi:UDP-glucose 4-epimerase